MMLREDVILRAFLTAVRHTDVHGAMIKKVLRILKLSFKNLFVFSTIESWLKVRSYFFLLVGHL